MTDLERDARIRREAMMEAARFVDGLDVDDDTHDYLGYAAGKLRALADSPPPASGGAGEEEGLRQALIEIRANGWCPCVHIATRALAATRGKEPRHHG